MDLSSSNFKAWTMAIAVHLFAALPLFWLEHSKPIFDPPKPKQIINATIIGELPKPPKPTPAIVKPKLEKSVKKPEVKVEKPKVDNSKRIAEEKAIRLKQEQEKQKKEQEEREKAKLEQEKRLAEQQQLEEQKRAKELADRKAEIRRKLQQAAKDMAAEDAQVARETDKLKSEMIEVISQQWVRPLGMDKKLSVVIELILLPSGELSGLKIIESSGDVAFDRSAMQAAKLASPFSMFLKYSPEVRNASRTTIIKFTPEDLFN